MRLISLSCESLKQSGVCNDSKRKSLPHESESKEHDGGYQAVITFTGAVLRQCVSSSTDTIRRPFQVRYTSGGTCCTFTLTFG